MDNLATALYIIIALGAIYLASWVWSFVKWRRAQRKTRASRLVNGTDWLIYDSTGRKVHRRELYEDMRRKEGKG
jgi:hypothetical protein